VSVGEGCAEPRLGMEFRDLVEAAPDALVIVDDGGRIVLVNGQRERLLGYPRSQLLGCSVEMLVPERFRGGHRRQRHGFFAASKARAMGIGLELLALRSDGREVPVEISLSPLETPAGRVVLSAIRDVSERRRSAEEIARLTAIVESARDAIVGASLEGIITSWNPAAERLYGYSAEAALGCHVSMLLSAAATEDEVTGMLWHGRGDQHLKATHRAKDARSLMRR